jgi:hypothetical protein
MKTTHWSIRNSLGTEITRLSAPEDIDPIAAYAIQSIGLTSDFLKSKGYTAKEIVTHHEFWNKIAVDLHSEAYITWGCLWASELRLLTLNNSPKIVPYHMDCQRNMLMSLDFLSVFFEDNLYFD